MAQLQRYLATHVSWRIASVTFAMIMVAVFWNTIGWMAYVFIAIGAFELVTLPYYWRRARRARMITSA
jgi:hypothetical protein